jgi:predicted alpha/beta superfamily hydrolase
MAFSVSLNSGLKRRFERTMSHNEAETQNAYVDHQTNTYESQPKQGGLAGHPVQHDQDMAILAQVSVIESPVKDKQSVSTNSLTVSADAANAELVPATYPKSRRFDFTSAVNGRTYRVNIAEPYMPAPPSGYPVLYILDGDAFFPTFADAVRIRGIGREVDNAIVVGIGYPEADEIWTVMGRRNLDFSPSDTSPAGIAEGLAMLQPGTELGGGDNFFKILQSEIRPRIATMSQVDKQKEMLWGHSLGGLFTLTTMFRHPEAFHTYLISDPSIWWDGRHVLEHEPAFSRQVNEGSVAPRVMLCINDKAQTPHNEHAGLPPDILERVNRDIIAQRSLDNVIELGARLDKLDRSQGFATLTKVYPNRDHMGVVFSELNDVLDFALPPRQPPSR